jgi:serine phosphatase RsbU (regulator of sigma subunit)
MNNIKTLILALFLITTYFNVSAIPRDIDSIKNRLNNAVDTAKIQILVDLALKYTDTDINQAFLYLNQALKIAEKHELDLLIGNCYLNLGQLYKYKGDYNSSINNYNKAVTLFLKGNYTSNLASAYNNIGVAYTEKGDYTPAVEYLLKSLKLTESFNDKAQLSKVLLNVGLVFYYQNNYQKALEYYNLSLNIRRNLNDKKGIALLYNNIGIVYYFQKNSKKALENFKYALHIYEELNNLRGQSMPLFNIAEIYFENDQVDSAFMYYKRSYKIDLLLDDQAGISKCLFKIAEIYNNKRNGDSAIFYANKALKKAIEIDSKQDIKDCYIFFSDFYYQDKNYKQAYDYLNKLNIINDSIYNNQSAELIAEMQTKYETEKKDLQLDKQKLEIDKQNIVSRILVIGLSIIALILIVLIIQFIQKKRAFRVLEIQKKNITDSINYASRIQTALLPPEDVLNKLLPEHFILFLPKDIVSGDFYWITLINNKTIVAVADCTGHGVPGAFMSMLGFAFLNEIVNKNPEIKANEILNELRLKVINTLHQDKKNNQDGMDIALAIIDTENKVIQFAGANNPLIIVRNNEVIHVAPDRMPIGTYSTEKTPFTLNELPLKTNDMVYLFTDGYIDQFGGEKNKKFGKKSFEKLLIETSSLQVKAQRYFLTEQLLIWMENFDQIDDILVMGLKIK